MRTSRSAILIVLLLSTELAAENERGTICIAPVFENSSADTAAPELSCKSEKLSLKIDTRDPVPWPAKQGTKIERLDLSVRHLVVVYCDGKPQQSFKFTFAAFKSKELCIFINDLYKTVQLWEVTRAPWCKCKKDARQKAVPR